MVKSISFPRILIFSFFIVTNNVFKVYKIPYKDNTTTASVASLIGIIYGVLAGLICLYLLMNQDRANNAAVNEGAAAGNVYRQSKWLKDPLKSAVQADLYTYINGVIHDEWPTMSQNKLIGEKNDLIIMKMSNQLLNYPIHTLEDEFIVANLTRAIDALFQGRQERIEMGGAQLSQAIWNVIFLSTLLLIAINYAFRVNFKLHIFSLAAFAVMAASVLFLLITLDRPFQGEFIVQPKTLQRVLLLMEHEKQSVDNTQVVEEKTKY